MLLAWNRLIYSRRNEHINMRNLRCYHHYFLDIDFRDIKSFVKGVRSVCS